MSYFDTVSTAGRKGSTLSRKPRGLSEPWESTPTSDAKAISGMRPIAGAMELTWEQ